jgi:hypothetical protein
MNVAGNLRLQRDLANGFGLRRVFQEHRYGPLGYGDHRYRSGGAVTTALPPWNAEMKTAGAAH